MPTKKTRVGFIPRSEVLDLINKLGFESNLSISKIVNILVEEALYKRGIFNIKNRKALKQDSRMNFNIDNRTKINNDENDSSNVVTNFINTENQHIKVSSEEFIDKEIYAKFLMFLQFQEKMKKGNK